MEMKQNRWILAFLAGGALLAVSSCEREMSTHEVGTPGAPIVFTAATSYVNGTGTRTEYSGVIYGDDNKIERIDWVKDVDKFTVNYAHGSTSESADFQVTSVSAEDYNSNAGVSAIGDNLSWADGTDHRFYAMYPSHAMNAAGTLNGAAFSATLYKEQNQTHTQEVTARVQTSETTYANYTYNRYLPDMKYAYMVAYADPTHGISGNGVTLPFRPAVTTFEFRLRRNAGESGARVKSFTLSSSTQALTGNFSFTINGGDERGATWGTVTVPEKTDENSVITVDFTQNDATGVELPSETAEEFLDFTIFALPVDLTNLTIRLTYMDNSARVLPLYDSKDAGGTITAWHTFTGAKKYVFTNSHVPGDDEYVYYIDNLSCEEVDGVGIVYVDTDDPTQVANVFVQFDSYKKNHTSQKIYVPIGKVEYSPDGTTGWTETLPSEFAATFGPSKVSGNPEDATIRLKSDAQMTAFSGTEVAEEPIDAGLYHTNILRGRSIVGESSSPRDLSLYTIDGRPRTGNKRVTANCYVVGNPGWFKFPLVYGNAIDQEKVTTGEGINEVAFNPESVLGTTGKRFWKRFQNYLGEGITSPYILEDTGVGINDVEAVIVWSDAGPVITSSGYSSDEHEIEQITNDDVVVLNEDHGYIRFFMDRTKIHQGNIVIALRKKASVDPAETILWSWHIWVSDGDMKPVRMSTVNSQVSVTPVRDYTDFLQYNLGWCEEGMTTVKSYKRDPYFVRVTQVDALGNHEVQVFKIIERAGVKVDAAMSSGTYYQWGRKDQILPSSGKVETAVIRTGRMVSESGNKFFFSPSNYQIAHDSEIITTQAGTYNMKDKALNYQMPMETHAGESIQHPYVFYHYPGVGYGGVGLSTGSQCGQWMRIEDSDSPYNLWDATMKPADDYDTNKDKLPQKTVYDPCPPGYVVPNQSAFLNFNGKGYYATIELDNWDPRSVYEGFTMFNVIDLNGDGDISDKDFDRGFYFKKSGASLDRPTISGRIDGLFFPAAGYRLAGKFTSDAILEGDVYEMGLEGWYWTTATNNRGRNFLFSTHYIYAGTGGEENYGFNMMCYNLKSTIGLSVRPMVDE